MGRIKTTMIKRNTKKLVREHGDTLSGDFTANKKAIGKVTIISSKKLRNIVAGYAARLMKKAKKE